MNLVIRYKNDESREDREIENVASYEIDECCGVTYLRVHFYDHFHAACAEDEDGEKLTCKHDPYSLLVNTECILEVEDDFEN